MSMIAMTQADKERHLKAVRGQLGAGNVEPVLACLPGEAPPRQGKSIKKLLTATHYADQVSVYWSPERSPG
jgi:hypothetical protein